ncbi:MAG TPA: HIG1 domain-containing protein [Burkholderiaceae bacterium]|nr:HIG1 domain-containing protein [Burkholderiaceae bacterium]
MSLMTIAIVLTLLATIYSLIGGLSSMVAGGEAGHRTSEQWMIRRVAFQALALVLLAIAALPG